MATAEKEVLTKGQAYAGGVVGYDSVSGRKLNDGETTVADPMSVITSDALKDTGKAYNLPPAIPQTTADGLQEGIGSLNKGVIDSANKEREERMNAQKETKDDLAGYLKDILNTNTEIGDVENSVSRTEEDKARKDLDDYTSQIEAEQLSNRRRIEKLQKENKQGLFGGALQDEVNRINRESVSKQADLAILQTSALRRYDTAKSIADRQVQLKLEPLKAKLDNLKFFYQENKEDFNKEDDRLYSEKIKAEEREYKKIETLENDIKDIKLEVAKNGAPATILAGLSTAQDFDEAVQLAGGYLATPQTDVVKLDSGATILIDKRTGRVIKNFGGGGGDGGGGGVNSLPKTTPESIKGLVNFGSLLDGFKSVDARKQFGKNLTELALQGDSRGVAERIVGGTIDNIADADTRKRVTGGFKIASQLTRLETLLNEYQEKGGNTNIFKGTIQNMTERVGSAGDPELARIGVQLVDTLDKLARARTGAVITKTEEDFYDRILPSTRKTAELNDALIGGLRTSLMADVENELQYSITSQGLDAVKAELPEVFGDSVQKNFTDQALMTNSKNNTFFSLFTESFNNLNK